MYPINFTDDNHPHGGLNPNSEQNKQTAKHLLEILKLSGLGQSDKLLDLGCGTGRLCYAIKEYMPPQNYIGVDISCEYIRIATDTHKMEFRLTDIKHPIFNKNGSIEPKDYKIPANDGEFDFCAIIAVFNHCKYQWIKPIINEVSRVLKPTGICLSTWFIINRHYEYIKNTLPKRYQFNYINDLTYNASETPCLNTAFSEPDLRKTILETKMRIIEPIRYGEWASGPAPLTGHDIMLLRQK